MGSSDQVPVLFCTKEFKDEKTASRKAQSLLKPKDTLKPRSGGLLEKAPELCQDGLLCTFFLLRD